MIEWLDEFYSSPETVALLEESFAPLFAEYGAAVAAVAGAEVGAKPAVTPFIQAIASTYISNYLDSSRAQMQEMLSAPDPRAAIEQRLAEWAEKRPGKVAQEATVQTSNAVTQTVYKDAGVTRKKWNARGKSCPYCRRMNGKVVGIDRPFHKEGDSIEVPDSEISAKAKLNFTHEIGHPPQHQGCDCVIEADMASFEQAASTQPHPAPEDTVAFRRLNEDKEYAWRYSHAPQEGGVNHDNFMTDLGNEIGFGGLPQRVSEAQLRTNISNGATEVYRAETKKAYAQQLVSGEYRIGKGQYGNGIYTAWGSEAEATARLFGGGSQGEVLHMALSPRARIIDYADAAKMATQTGGTYDVGRWAMMQGYDAIRVTYPGGFDPRHGRVGGGEYVVFNRSLLQVVA